MLLEMLTSVETWLPYNTRVYLEKARQNATDNNNFTVQQCKVSIEEELRPLLEESVKNINFIKAHSLN
jgi:hypothetical protein